MIPMLPKGAIIITTSSIGRISPVPAGLYAATRRQSSITAVALAAKQVARKRNSREYCRAGLSGQRCKFPGGQTGDKNSTSLVSGRNEAGRPTGGAGTGNSRVYLATRESQLRYRRVRRVRREHLSWHMKSIRWHTSVTRAPS